MNVVLPFRVSVSSIGRAPNNHMEPRLMCGVMPQETETHVLSRISRVGILIAATLLLAEAIPVRAQINETLQRELVDMLRTDQSGRETIQAAQEKHGFDSPEVKALWEAQYAVDRRNVERLKEIIAIHGWPGRSLVGPQAETVGFIIIQHADHATQVEYLPMLKQAVAEGELQGQALAFLEDRILVAEGKKQLYGTQLRWSAETGQLEPVPVEDEANVDVRRAELGLGPLDEYVKRVRAQGGG